MWGWQELGEKAAVLKAAAEAVLAKAEAQPALVKLPAAARAELEQLSTGTCAACLEIINGPQPVVVEELGKRCLLPRA